jgi:hypothetical protein
MPLVTRRHKRGYIGAEPADTQEFIHERFAGKASRKKEKAALRELQDPRARRFRRENPDADIYDYARSLEEK